MTEILEQTDTREREIYFAIHSLYDTTKYKKEKIPVNKWPGSIDYPQGFRIKMLPNQDQDATCRATSKSRCYQQRKKFSSILEVKVPQHLCVFAKGI